MNQWLAVHHEQTINMFLKNNDSVITIQYSHGILTLGDMERFLITTQSITRYRSFEPQLLQQTKNLEAVSEPELKWYELLMVTAPNDQHADILLPLTY
jgi:hypothetical protein